MENKIANKESWKNVEMPNESINLDLDIEIHLNEQELELLKKGHIPEAMEDHWFMYFENNKLYIHRSWTGFCTYIIYVSEDGTICNAQVNRNIKQYANVNIDYDKYMIIHLIFNMIGRKNEAADMLDKALIAERVSNKENSNCLFQDWEDANVQSKVNDNAQQLEEIMNKFIDEYKEDELSEEDKEFQKYCKLYEERFGKHAYIAEPSGTKEQTINAIKICLEKNEDILDEILYPKQEFKPEVNSNISLTEKNEGIFKKIINVIKRIFNKK
jgi:8-oxo-dGTP diphosphatase